VGTSLVNELYFLYEVGHCHVYVPHVKFDHTTDPYVIYVPYLDDTAYSCHVYVPRVKSDRITDHLCYVSIIFR